jgi:Predicted metal-dependent membrane protease
VPQWGAFLAVVAVLTVTLLVLARRSQQVLREHAVGGNPDRPGTDNDTAAGETVATADSTPPGTGVTTVDNGTVTERSDPGPADRDTAVAESGMQEVVTTDSGETVRLTTGAALTNVASTQVAFAGGVMAAAWFLSIPVSAFGVTAGPVTDVALGLGFGLALWGLSELSAAVADAVGMGYDETVRALLAPESTPGWAALFLVVLPLIAFAEELLFRGALVGVPAAGFGVSPWALAIVASVAFALGHGAQGRAGIVVTGVLGFALATGYVLTDSLLVVVVAHYVINAMEFLVHEALGVDDAPGLGNLTG